MRRRLVTIVAVGWILIAGIAALASEGSEELGPPMRLQEAKAGMLLLQTELAGVYLPAPTLETEIVTEVTGLVARTAVEQRFSNPTEQWVEGIYVFPLPEDAAVDRLRMRVGERIIEGEIRERDEARQAYEQAKREGRKASLVEQERPNLFTSSVANIGPGETVTVSIEFQEEIRYDSGRFSLRFPLVVAPRYIPGRTEGPAEGFSPTGWSLPTDQVPDAHRITPPVVCEELEEEGETGVAAVDRPVRIAIVLDPGLPLARVTSPSHRIEVTAAEGLYAVGLQPGAVPADRDFVLEWEPDVDRGPRAAAFAQELDGERYVLLMVMPPGERSGELDRLARETVFVIDTSGSMQGSSIRQATEALLLALDRLRPDDLFNVIRFSNRSRRLFELSVPASSSYLREARAWVEAIEADGGTEILGALENALADPVPDGTLRQIVFITDGSVGNEDQILSYLGEKLGENRIFTVGIGSAPNAYFMRKVAEMGRGTFTYIESVQRVAREMGELFRKLESPVLRDLEVIWDDPGVESWPDPVGDLYAGEPLRVVARMPVGGRELRIAGWREGAPWGQRFTLDATGDAVGLDKLWARRKIEALMDRRHQGSPEDEIRAGVVEVALRHHLVSKYTSLVAIDPVPTAPDGSVPVTRPLPVQLPAGWKGSWPGPGQLPRTAAGLESRLRRGTVLLLFALVLAASRRNVLRRGRRPT